MNRFLILTVVFLCAVSPGEMAFAEGETEPERLAEQLSESSEQKQRALGKRWESLIRRRQWTSASGKHKTFAKYVDHAPDLSWVKLLVLVKSGEEQTEKEIQVPLEKLDKKGRAVLDRIALRRKEVEKALAISESTSGGGRRRAESDSRREEEPQRGRGSRGGRESQREEEPQREDEPQREEEPQREDEPRRRDDSQREEESIPDLNTPSLPDDAPWRNSYEDFIGNLSATKIDPEGDEHDMATWQIDWGELQAIRRRWEALSSGPQEDQEQVPRETASGTGRMSEEASPQVGEVVWEGVLKNYFDAGGEIVFEFPDAPKPFDVTFFLEKENPGNWQRFEPGDKTRFIGRFQAYGIETPTIILHIRFPDEQPSNRPSRGRGRGRQRE